MRLPLAFALLLSAAFARRAPAQYVYRGLVLDDAGQPAPYVLVSAGQTGTYTAEDGRFALETDAPADTLRFSSVLYADTSVAAAAWANGTSLRLRGARLATAVVVARERQPPGSYALNREQLAAVPAIGGEVDVLRALQTLPSVAGGAEGTVAPVIRGSEPQASLILLDGAPIYSPSSFFGYQGAINYETVRAADVYADYTPVEFGGRSGGVVDVSTRVGNRERHRRKISLGVPNAGLAFEGPVTERVAYLAAARGSYLAGPLALGGTRFYQGDALAKANFVGEHWSHQGSYFRNVSSIGVNSTRDRGAGTQLIDQVTGFGNELVSLRSTYRRGRFGLDALLVQSRYLTTNDFAERAEVDGEDTRLIQDTEVAGGVTERALRGTGSYETRRARLRLGAEVKRHRFRTDFRSTLIDDALDEDTVTGGSRGALTTASPYADVRLRLTDALDLDLGARATLFFGADGRRFGEVLEPRAAFGYRVTPRTRATVAVNRGTQYVHAFGSATTAGSFETFAAPTPAYPPARTDQVSASLETALLGERLSLRASVYLKRMRGLVQGLNSARAVFDNELDASDANLLRGEGEASGLELSLGYATPTLGLRVGYAYARSFRRFAGLNAGRAFPFRWDRPHRLSALLSYAPAKSRWRYSAQFLFESGYAFTAPRGTTFRTVGRDALAAETPIVLVDALHNRRARTLQRLDLGAEWTTTRLNGNVLSWRFSLTNALFRRNPSATFVEAVGFFDVGSGGEVQELTIRERSLFRLLPGVQYSFTW